MGSLTPGTAHTVYCNETQIYYTMCDGAAPVHANHRGSICTGICFNIDETLLFISLKFQGEEGIEIVPLKWGFNHNNWKR